MFKVKQSSLAGYTSLAKAAAKVGGIPRFWGSELLVLLLGGVDGGWIHVGPYVEMAF